LADSYLILNLELPENFEEELYKTINDEIALAQKKWKLKLSDDQKLKVFESSRTQTRLKTSTIAKQTWDLGRKLSLKVTFTKNTQIELKPDSNFTATHKKINLVLTKDGWVIANEESEDPVNITEILDKQIEVIKQWARTAAFYGVGSYSR
jgi:hypothetical protein